MQRMAAAAADTARRNRLGSDDANNGTDNANTGADNANTGADNANNSTDNANNSTDNANNSTDNANNSTDNANNSTDNANTSTMDDGTRTLVPIDFVAEQQHLLAPIMRQTGKLHLNQVARLRDERHELRLLRRRRLRAQTLRRIAS
jgi:hypothetical protein